MGKGKKNAMVKSGLPADEELKTMLIDVIKKTVQQSSKVNKTDVPHTISKEASTLRASGNIVSKKNDTSELTYTVTINCLYAPTLSQKNREAISQEIQKKFLKKIKDQYGVKLKSEFIFNNDGVLEGTPLDRIKQFAAELYSEEAKRQECMHQLCNQSLQETHGEKIESAYLNQNFREHVLYIIAEVLGDAPTISQSADNIKTIACQIRSLTQQCVSSRYNKLIDHKGDTTKILEVLKKDTLKLLDIKSREDNPKTNEEFAGKLRSLPKTVLNLLQVMSLKQLSEDLIEDRHKLRSECAVVEGIIKRWDSCVMTILQKMNTFFTKHEKINIFGMYFEATSTQLCTQWGKEKDRMLDNLQNIARTGEMIDSVWTQPMHPILLETYKTISDRLNSECHEAKQASKQAKAKAKAEEHRRSIGLAIPAKSPSMTFFDDNRDSADKTVESKRDALIKIEEQARKLHAHQERYTSETVDDDSAPRPLLRPIYRLSTTDKGETTFSIMGEDRNIFTISDNESLLVASCSCHVEELEIEPFKETLQRGRLLSRAGKGQSGLTIGFGGQWLSVKKVGNLSDCRLICVPLETPDKKIIFVPMAVFNHEHQKRLYQKRPDCIRRIEVFKDDNRIEFFQDKEMNVSEPASRAPIS